MKKFKILSLFVMIAAAVWIVLFCRECARAPRLNEFYFDMACKRSLQMSEAHPIFCKKERE